MEDNGMYTNGILEQIDMSEITKVLSSVFPETQVSFEQIFTQLLSGNFSNSIKLFIEFLKQALFQGILESKQIFLILLLIGILGAVLGSLTEVFTNRQVIRFAHYFIYLMLAVFLLKSFQLSLSISQQAVSLVVDFMRAFLPVYCISLCLGSGVATAYGYYQMVFFIIFVLESVLLSVFIPICECYAFLVVMNGVAKEKRFDGILHMLDKMISGGVKVILVLTVGSSLLQSMITPAIDNVNTKLLQKSIGAIPGLGDITDSMTDIFLSSALLVKNSLGAAALICLVFICILPLLKLFCLGAAIKLAGALIGIFGEKKQVHFIEQMSNGSFYIFKVTLCAMAMFFISIAMIANVTIGGM